MLEGGSLPLLMLVLQYISLCTMPKRLRKKTARLLEDAEAVVDRVSAMKLERVPSTGVSRSLPTSLQAGVATTHGERVLTGSQSISKTPTLISDILI